MGYRNLSSGKGSHFAIFCHSECVLRDPFETHCILTREDPADAARGRDPSVELRATDRTAAPARRARRPVTPCSWKPRRRLNRVVYAQCI